MNEPIKARDCGACKKRPTHTAEPCGHRFCYDHYLDSATTANGVETEFCLLCGERCQRFSESDTSFLPQPWDIRDTTWRVDLKNMAPKPETWPIMYPARDAKHTPLLPLPKHRFNSRETPSVLSSEHTIDAEAASKSTANAQLHTGSTLNPNATIFRAPFGRPESASSTNTFRTEGFTASGTATNQTTHANIGHHAIPTAAKYAAASMRASLGFQNPAFAPTAPASTSSHELEPPNPTDPTPEERYHVLPTGVVPFPAFGQFPPRPFTGFSADSIANTPQLHNFVAGVKKDSDAICIQNIAQSAFGSRADQQRASNTSYGGFKQGDRGPTSLGDVHDIHPLSSRALARRIPTGPSSQSQYSSQRMSAWQQGLTDQHTARADTPGTAFLKSGVSSMYGSTQPLARHASPAGAALGFNAGSGHTMSFPGQPQSQLPSFSSGAPTPSQFAQQITQGLTESPYEQWQPPKSPVHRPADPAFTPARFTSNKARMDSLAIDHAALGAKWYAERYAYLDVLSRPAAPPAWLGAARQGLYWPTLAEGFAALPFAEPCRLTGPCKGGVVKLSDFPYATTKAEIVAFIGRSAAIVAQPKGSPYFAIHIILERESGKTNDCFVEVQTADGAGYLVRHFQKRAAHGGRAPKIGNRDVKVALSSQEELMDALFPKAKNVRWVGAQPVVIVDRVKYYEDRAPAGFQGFFDAEEFYHLVKFGDAPERNPFINRNPTRAYETLISILHKYPWYEPEHVTLEERRRLFDATFKMVRALAGWLHTNWQKKPDPHEQSEALLQELVVAALTCPGFSEKQMGAIVGELHSSGFGKLAAGKHVGVPLGGSHELARFWPFVAVCKAPGADMNLVKFYAALFRQATNGANMSLADLHRARMQGHDPFPMGAPPHLPLGEESKKMTLTQVAKIEFDSIARMLASVLPNNIPNNRPSGGGGRGSATLLQ